MGEGPILTAIRKRKVTLFFTIFIFILGLYCYYITPKQENPEILAPYTIITAIYPGATPEEVEKNVTEKIEDKLIEIEGYDFCESYSRNSLSMILFKLTNDVDVDSTWNKLRQKMDAVQGSLPEGCQKININTELDKMADVMISISGDNYTFAELGNFAEQIKDKIEKINGVAYFEVIGERGREVRVEVDSAKLLNTRLSLSDVIQAISLQNMEIPPGKLEKQDTSINITMPGKFTSLKDIENIVLDISPQNGAVLRLKDIACISFNEKNPDYFFRHAGQETLLLTGYFQKNKNNIAVGKKVEKELAEIKAGLPAQLNIDEVVFHHKDVQTATRQFSLNLLEGIIFVVLVIYLGMGIRNALLISAVIPFSVLLTFITMYILGIRIHQISIASLIIALGMLVDNAITVIDAIQVRLDNDEERLKSCILGTKDVALPVLTATLTTIAAFIPLLILPGVVGEYLRSIPQILIISLSASYIAALLVSPTMAFAFLKKSNNPNTKSAVQEKFYRLWERCMERKGKTVLCIFLVFLVTLYLSSLLPVIFFPKAEKELIYLDITAEQTASLNKTEDVIKQVEKILKEQKEVESYTSSIGTGLPKFFITMIYPIQTPELGQIMVKLDLSAGNRFKYNGQFVDYLQEELDAKVTGGSVVVQELERTEPDLAPIIVRLTGSDREMLAMKGKEIKKILTGIEGTTKVRDDANERSYDFLIEIDRDMASRLGGVTNFDVQKEVNIALKGRLASLYREAGKEHEIMVTSDIYSKNELENLPIKSTLTGQKVLLKQIAQVNLTSQFPILKRYDREEIFTVLANVQDGYSAVTIQNQLQEKLKNLDLQGVKIAYDGEKEKIVTNFRNLLTASFFAAFLIYIILLMEFNSLKQPLVIMITLPFSLIGSIWGLFLFKQPLSFTALLGVISLFGIVVNDAITLVDYINAERGKGNNLKAACRVAVAKRVRPILLTSFTTILGLMPLALGHDFFVPLAVALMSGLLVATFLTLIVVPVVYCLSEKTY
jgi:multidrug efflux pump